MDNVIGLMSGTSLDGIDAALLQTDGHVLGVRGAALTVPYDEAFKARLRAQLGQTRRTPEVQALEQELTHYHARAILQLLQQHRGERPTLIGFHGQTLSHNPQQRHTLQIGDGALLAYLTGLRVVNDFRTQDVRAGGEGAPLVPLYHQALAAHLPKPVLVVNLGGVANITYLGHNNVVLACDTGAGNALIDDWMLRHTGQNCDFGGEMAAAGVVDNTLLQQWLSHPFFSRALPKSLDRDAFAHTLKMALPLADGAATLTAFTAASLAAILPQLPEKPQRILVCGGGRYNATLMGMIAAYTGISTQTVEAVGWQGDALEAQAFAYLAARVVRGLYTSLPTTTGVAMPLCGGVVHFSVQ